jgi:hypothetical protein
MTPPATVSLQVPYTNTEQQFLILAVQTAVRTFRSMNGHSGDRTLNAIIAGPFELCFALLEAVPESTDRELEARLLFRKEAGFMGGERRFESPDRVLRRQLLSSAACRLLPSALLLYYSVQR